MTRPSTKAVRAAALLKNLANGPAYLNDLGNEKMRRDYDLWVQTWIIPEVSYLVPELRKKAEQGHST